MVSDEGILDALGGGCQIVRRVRFRERVADQRQLALEFVPILLLEMHLHGGADPVADGQQDECRGGGEEQREAEGDRRGAFHVASGFSRT